eukprot:5546111-Amphidinium_carterae.1
MGAYSLGKTRLGAVNRGVPEDGVHMLQAPVGGKNGSSELTTRRSKHKEFQHELREKSSLRKRLHATKLKNSGKQSIC